MQNKLRCNSGFSLVELMIVLVVLTLVMGVVFQQMIQVQQRSRVEDTKLDMTQEGREFVDEMVRDLHQSGYPPARTFAPGVIANNTDSRAAVGIASISSTSITFEGDVNGDGNVDSVRYTLIADPANGTGQCPCLLQRSQVAKVNGTAPTAQPTNYSTEVQNVINSGLAGGGGPNGSLGMAGNDPGSGLTNNVVYGQWMGAPLFQAFDQNGNLVALPADITTAPGQTAIASIKTIKINVNMLSNQFDQQLATRPAITLSAAARLSN